MRVCRTSPSVPSGLVRHPSFHSPASLTAPPRAAASSLQSKDRVRGRVTDPSAGDVRPFDFDPNAMTEVQLADALWELI